MTAFRVEPGVNAALDDIYDYTHASWGEAQAEGYIAGLFDEFAAIAERHVPWRPIAAEFGVDGYCRRWRRHIIYWKIASDGQIAIFALLHERMDHSVQLRDSPSEEK